MAHAKSGFLSDQGLILAKAIFQFCLVLALAIWGYDWFMFSRATQKIESRLYEINRLDWNKGIRLDQLVEAHDLCVTKSTLRGCETTHELLADIADTRSTCLNDNRSALCNKAIAEIGNHPILKMLPQGHARTLPSNPFYLRLPTRALESRSTEFGYRREALSWWWKQWHFVIVFFCSLSLAATSFFLYRRKKRTAEMQRSAERDRQRFREEEQRREQEELERAARIRKQQQEAQKRITEQNLIEKKQLETLRREEEERNSEEAKAAAEKLAAEKAEAAEFLKLMVALGEANDKYGKLRAIKLRPFISNQ